MTSVNIPAIQCADYASFFDILCLQLNFYQLNLEKKLCNSEHFLQKQREDTIK